MRLTDWGVGVVGGQAWVASTKLNIGWGPAVHGHENRMGANIKNGEKIKKKQIKKKHGG